MIKIDGKTLHIEGKGTQVFMELTFLLHEIREMLDDEAIDLAVSLSDTKAIEIMMEKIFGKEEKSPLDSLLEELEALEEGDEVS